MGVSYSRTLFLLFVLLFCPMAATGAEKEQQWPVCSEDPQVVADHLKKLGGQKEGSGTLFFIRFFSYEIYRMPDKSQVVVTVSRISSPKNLNVPIDWTCAVNRFEDLEEEQDS